MSLLRAASVLLLAALAGCWDAPRPSVRLVDLDGGDVDPFASTDAPATVFLFARTDCPISNRYAPEIRRIHEKFEPRGVVFFLVYPDPEQSPEAIRKHLRDYRYGCSALRDPQHALVGLTNATITPEAAVFVPPATLRYRGRIDDRYVALGDVRAAPTTHDLEDAIEAALTGGPIANPRTKAIGCIIADLK